MIVNAIKFKDGTYYAGCNKNPSQTILGAQLYKSEKKAQNVVNKSVNFPSSRVDSYSIIKISLEEMEEDLER